jgi:hypothetical protein
LQIDVEIHVVTPENAIQKTWGIPSLGLSRQNTEGASENPVGTASLGGCIPKEEQSKEAINIHRTDLQ